jgi:hypothetical protein
MPLGLRESPPDTTIQFLHMSNKILVTLDIQNGVWHVNEVRHLNLLTFALGDESLGGSEGAGAEACGASQVDLLCPSGLPRRTRTRGVVLGLRRLALTTTLIVVLLAPRAPSISSGGGLLALQGLLSDPSPSSCPCEAL